MPDTVKPDCDSEVLSKLKLFAGFKEDELSALLSLCDCESHKAGNLIVAQGESGVCMYLILSGSARVYFEGNNQRITLAELESGDFFGELSLVDDGPRSANVIAVEDCSLLRITRLVVGVLAGIKPSAAIQLLAAIGRCLVNRLRHGNQKYIDLILLGHRETESPAEAT